MENGRIGHVWVSARGQSGWRGSQSGCYKYFSSITILPHQHISFTRKFCFYRARARIGSSTPFGECVRRGKARRIHAKVLVIEKEQDQLDSMEMCGVLFADVSIASQWYEPNIIKQATIGISDSNLRTKDETKYDDAPSNRS